MEEEGWVNESNEEEVISADDEVEAIHADEIVLVLVNSSDSDLIIDGKGSFRDRQSPPFRFGMKNRRLSKFGKLVLFKIERKIIVEATDYSWENGLKLVVELDLSAKEKEVEILHDAVPTTEEAGS